MTWKPFCFKCSTLAKANGISLICEWRTYVQISLTPTWYSPFCRDQRLFWHKQWLLFWETVKEKLGNIFFDSSLPFPSTMKRAPEEQNLKHWITRGSLICSRLNFFWLWCSGLWHGDEITEDNLADILRYDLLNALELLA